MFMLINILLLYGVHYYSYVIIYSIISDQNEINLDDLTENGSDNKALYY
jgi:hypothetical protein